MAIVDNIMYPEIYESPIDHDSLNIAIIGDHLPDIQHEMNILTTYCLMKKRGDLFGIKGFAVPSTKSVNKAFIAKQDVDLVYDKDKKLSRKRLNELCNITICRTDKKSLLSEIEAYLLGNGIFMAFGSPAFGLHAFGKYVSTPWLRADKFINLTSQYPDYGNQFRFLLNKLNSIAYAVDNTKYLVQLRNKANRRGSKMRRNSLEINYHLNNFYFLIASVFDILARLLNRVYGLGIPETAAAELGVEKKKLRSRLNKVAPDVKNVISSEMMEWVKRIKNVRNAIAHEESLTNSMVVQEKPEAKRLSSNEINELITTQYGKSISNAARYYGEAAAKNMQEAIKYKIQMENNYDLITNDAIILKQEKQSEALFNPIVSLDFDLEKSQEYTWAILDKIDFSYQPKS